MLDPFNVRTAIVMIPLFATTKAAYRAPTRFFSERTGAGRFTLQLTKSSATNLWPQAWWMALAVCTFATACKESKQTPPPVTVATPIRKEIVEWDEYTGRTAAVERVEIRPRVSGYIDRISFEDGQLVKPGDVLFVRR
jgi:multidrug efflux pump subunit AcrA (membrane-fusion protein)